MDERVAGRYRLEKPIGSGGMAEVWRATDTRSGAVVAVKRLHPGVARDETARARFRREVDASRAITHPAAVGVLDADPDADVPWLAMEHVEGGSLADALKDGPLEPRAVLSIASDAASALAALHAAGIVHRDVTPSNILLTDRGSRLADFGIARTWDGSALDDVTITGDLVGTMRFVAPEVLAGEPVTPAADVWALGAVIHEALTGTRPFDASSPGALLASQRTPPPAPSGLPDDVQATLGGMLDPDPARRPSADAVASTMSAAVDPGVDDPTRVIEAGTVAFASVLPLRAIAGDGARRTPRRRPCPGNGTRPSLRHRVVPPQPGCRRRRRPQCRRHGRSRRDRAVRIDRGPLPRDSWWPLRCCCSERWCSAPPRSPNGSRRPARDRRRHSPPRPHRRTRPRPW